MGFCLVLYFFYRCSDSKWGDVPCCLLAISFSYTPTLYQDVESSLARWVQHMTGKRKEIAHQRSDCTSYFIHRLQSNFASSLTVSSSLVFIICKSPTIGRCKEVQGDAKLTLERD